MADNLSFIVADLRRPFNSFSYCPALAAASPAAPTKHELAINLKATKALGLTVPVSELSRYRMNSGQNMLASSFSGFDPIRTFGRSV
jgi:hypothetical protein